MSETDYFKIKLNSEQKAWIARQVESASERGLYLDMVKTIAEMAFKKGLWDGINSNAKYDTSTSSQER